MKEVEFLLIKTRIHHVVDPSPHQTIDHYSLVLYRLRVQI